MTNGEGQPRRGGVGGILVAVAIAVAGWFIGNGLTNIRTADRFVTVKGVSERPVKADLATWPIQLAITDDNVSIAQTRINQNVAKVHAFLLANGIDSSEVELQNLKVTDVLAAVYNPSTRAGNRFIIQQTVMVRSEDPKRSARRARRLGNWSTPASCSPRGRNGDQAGRATSSGDSTTSSRA